MRQVSHPLSGGDDAPPVEIPKNHVGPVVIPGTNREVWWTGRVAIGLRYERGTGGTPLGQSASWVQAVLLGSR